MHTNEKRDESHVASAAVSRAAVSPRLRAMYGTASCPERPVLNKNTVPACRRRRGVSCVQLCATMMLVRFMWEHPCWTNA